MKIKFDTETIRLITLFENLTGAPVKDCIQDDSTNTVCFMIEEGKTGIAIGKNGNNVKNAERIMGKNIKIFEFSNDLITFIKNLIPHALEIKINEEENIVELKVEKSEKGLIIGRDEKNLKLYKEIIQRNFNLKDLKVK